MTLDVVIFLFVSSRERYCLIPDLRSDQPCSPFRETYDEPARSYWYWSLCVSSRKEPKLWKIVKGFTRFSRVHYEDLTTPYPCMEAPSGCRWYYVFLKVSISLLEGKPVYQLDIPVVRAEVYFNYHLLPDCGQLPALAVVCSSWAYVFV